MFEATLKKHHGIEPGSAAVVDRGPLVGRDRESERGLGLTSLKDTHEIGDSACWRANHKANLRALGRDAGDRREIERPRDVFERLFGDGTSSQERRRDRERNASILDAVVEQLSMKLICIPDVFGSPPNLTRLSKSQPTISQWEATDRLVFEHQKVFGSKP